MNATRERIFNNQGQHCGYEGEKHSTPSSCEATCTHVWKHNKELDATICARCDLLQEEE